MSTNTDQDVDWVSTEMSIKGVDRHLTTNAFSTPDPIQLASECYFNHLQ